MRDCGRILMLSECNIIPSATLSISHCSPISSIASATADKMLTVRVGCTIHFECESTATVILLVNPRFDSDRPIRQENLDFGIATKSESFTDTDGNVAYRVILGTGLNQIRHDAMVEGSTALDKSEQYGKAPSIA